MNTRFLLAAACLAAAVVFGCSGDDSRPAPEPLRTVTPAPAVTAPPVAAATPAPPSADQARLAADLIAAAARGDYAAYQSRYAEELKTQLPPAKFAELWQQLTDQAGVYQRQEGVRSERLDGFNVHAVICSFEKQVIELMVVFNAAGQIAGLRSQAGALYTPPAYVQQDAFTEREIVIGTGDLQLPGTLSVPKGNGPHPVVVLIHGSGPSDRDGTLPPNKPFKDLAWGLATRGIAVLRYEKRTRIYPSRFGRNAYTINEEVTDDVVAAVAAARAAPEVDPARVYLLGHSLGGMMLPRVLSTDPRIAGGITLAGAVRPLPDAILDQVTYISTLDGPNAEASRANLPKLREQVARATAPTLSAQTPPNDLPFGLPASYWLSLRGYSPAEIAAKLPQPLLILQGERDYQVTMAGDFEAWRKALAAKGNATVKSYPTLNHLFMAGEGKITPEEYLKAGHVDEAVIADIAAWISAGR